ncbi:MAG: hypothetical protein ACLT74_04080 [Christensenellales bacterium]
MMSRKPSRLLALVLLTALCCLLLAPCALAFERVDLTHPLTFAIQADDNEDDAHLPGVTFRLYQVADMDADARFALRSPYSTLNIDINALKNAADWAAASEAMKALTASETPDFTGTTDENGRVAFAGLSGLYLVSGTPLSSAAGRTASILPDLCADAQCGRRVAVRCPLHHQAGAFPRAD